jgi:hypothetical protein
MINAAMPRLTRMSHQIFGENSAMSEAMVAALNDKRDEISLMMERAVETADKAFAYSGWVDWDQALRFAHQWRADSSRIFPIVQDIITRFDTILHDAGAR